MSSARTRTRARPPQGNSAQRLATGTVARSEILAAASRLSTLARHCFGPAGAGEWIGPDANGVKSNCSPTVLARAASLRQSLHERDPALRLALQLLAAQERAHGDAGLLATLIATETLRQAHDRGLEPRALRAGLEWALAQSASDLHPGSGALLFLRQEVKLSDRETLRGLLETAMATKHACIAWNPCTNEARHVSQVLLDAFLVSLNVDAQGRISSGLKLVVNPGEPVLASRALRSELVLDIPLAPAIWNRLAQYQREHGSSAGHVILFSTSLLLSGDEVDVGFALTTESYESSAAANQRSTEWTARDAETKLLAKLADRIVNIPGAEVRYVFSQRLIHPWLRMHLLERGIIAVERVSATHLAAVQELTGAHVFRSAAVLAAGSSALDVTHLGNVGAVEVLRSGSGKRLLRVQAGSRGARVASVVLCAPDEAAADELRVVAQRAIVMLKAFVHNPFALLGAGATELALATRLRQVWAKEAPTAAHASSAEILASALDSVVRALQPAPVSSGGLTGFDVLDELMDCKNNASKIARGWDPLLERCINPQTVLDSGPAKAHALQVGVQTAIVLFGIGSIIIEDMSSDARPR